MQVVDDSLFASVEPVAPATLGTVGMRADVLAYMRAAARLVVTNHYMHADLSRMPLDVVGKTGTAEKLGKRDFAWFAGYAPAEDPKLVVVCIIEQGGFGGGKIAIKGKSVKLCTRFSINTHFTTKK